MQIEGTITDVLETWPLQLSVETAQGKYHVALESNTRIVLKGRHVDANTLREHRHVRVTGEKSGANALQAHIIEILE